MGVRFNLSFRDAEELMTERGVDDDGTVLDIVVQRRRSQKPSHENWKNLS